MTFLDRYLAEEVTEDQIHDYIDYWHNSIGESRALHDFLGLTWSEYAMWVESSGSALQKIREERWNAASGRIVRYGID